MAVSTRPPPTAPAPAAPAASSDPSIAAALPWTDSGPVAEEAGGARAFRLTGLLRWSVLAGAVVAGFHASLASVVSQICDGDPLGYLLLIPWWAALVAFGTARRRPEALPVHDRQLDWIVAAALLALIGPVDALLAPRLGVAAQLWRVDLFAVVLFALGTSVLLFGSRRVGSQWPVLVLLLAAWPLPYRMLGAVLGGTNTDFALLNVGLAVVASALAVGNPVRRWAAAAVVTVAVGALGVAVASVVGGVLQQLLPAAVAPAVAVGAVWTTADRGRVPLASAPASTGTAPAPRSAWWLSASFVLVLAAVLAWWSPAVPASVSPSSLALAPAPTGSALSAPPPGWRAGTTQKVPWAARYYGAGSTLLRHSFTPDRPGTGGPPFAVDVLTVRHTGPLAVYPAVSCYQLPLGYVEGGRQSLGRGVVATLFYDSTSLVTGAGQPMWAMLTWTWRVPGPGGTEYQRVDVVTADVGTGRGGIPALAAPAGNHQVRATVERLLRGTHGQTVTPPGPATLRRLIASSRFLVHHGEGTTATGAHGASGEGR